MAEGLTPAIRASDADRDATVLRLREAMIEGRLTLDDFSVRTDAALTAVTRGQLAAVVQDLPAYGAATSFTPRQATGWSPWVIGIMGSARREGRWRVGHEIHAVALMGETRIDLRQAIIDQSLITVNAICVMGRIEVIVPEGVEVDLQGIAIMGSKEMRMSDAALLEGAPLVRIAGIALMGRIEVRNKPSLFERIRQRLDS